MEKNTQNEVNGVSPVAFEGRRRIACGTLDEVALAAAEQADVHLGLERADQRAD